VEGKKAQTQLSKTKLEKVCKSLKPIRAQLVCLSFLSFDTALQKSSVAKVHTFSWFMCRKILISRNVRFASILLANAFPIFLIATSSPVSLFTAELQAKQEVFSTGSGPF
jgi:hypothetical protein